MALSDVLTFLTLSFATVFQTLGRRRRGFAHIVAILVIIIVILVILLILSI